MFTTNSLSRNIHSIFTRPVSVVLFGILLAAPPLHADDDMDDKGPAGGASTPTQDFDTRSRQNSRPKFDWRRGSRGGYSLIYVNEPASEPAPRFPTRITLFTPAMSLSN